MMRRILSLTAMVLATCAASAAADESSGPFASGVFAATVSGSKTQPSFAGSFGYRFNRVLGLELEVAGVPNFEAPLGGNAVFAFRAPQVGVVRTDRDGRAVFFTTNFRVAIPIGIRRVTPYFTAGGGLVSLRQKEQIAILQPVPLQPTPGPGRSPGGQLPVPIPRPILTRTATDLTLGLGGGVSFLLGKGLSLDADLHYYRVLSARDMNLGRFGMGIGYRF